ncbi:hypothetical protein LMH87_003918 [Akanthomyces muscarius]|uniref:O-methyltransferase n=1 Tax=Akanthomyces muscarius TaxID=2231603 RepID=A0A9W8Q5G5_AKAMU|nr:hypothetical protein LMH87_003918 [Akanthomyces muscarius]KAJ4145057.1 hypothetical protein LMH87_003918 [Akanthomyces muscarius]
MTETPASIIAQLASYDEKSLTDDRQARTAALTLSEKLSTCLQDPGLYAWKTALSPLSNLAVRVAIDLDIFSLLAAESKPVSSTFVAAATRSDPALVHRLLRACSSIGFVGQSGDGGDAWSANAVTRKMAVGAMAAWHRMFWDLVVTAAVHGPPALRDNGHRSPGEAGFTRRAFGGALDYFGLVQSMPATNRDFNDAMTLDTGAPEPWFRWFPVEERLLAGLAQDDAPLLVDVAGGRGHDVQAFQEAFPGRGRLVLQDMAHAIGSIGGGPVAPPLDAAIVRQTHDFFTAQPVRGARAYFLRRVLHDWPDSCCLRILKELRGAMRPGYSKLLIHEAILPDSGATRAQCEFDMTMMVVNGGLERSERQWAELLAEAGFEVVQFWQKYPDSEGIIEAIISPL